MRIIAGKYKGKVLSEFKLSSTRPTADMVREALFDKIGLDVSGKTFLDLFAGTGAVGIEAISRGAKFCHFVDSQKEAINLIRSNIKKTDAQNYEIVFSSFEVALKNFAKSQTRFDFVFLDPPYATDFAETAINLIEKYDLLCDDGLLIWEHDSTKEEYIKSNFQDYITKRYGKKYLTYIYKNK